MASPHHFLLVTFPGQGHINPSLQFCNRLLHFGARVTFVTATHASRRIADSNPSSDLSFASFSDGYDGGGPTSDTDVNHYMATLERRGSETLREFIVSRGDEAFTCVFYTFLMPWVSEVATSLNIPSTLVWIQPATVFCIYYHYFNGYEDMFRTAATTSVTLPGLPGLSFSGGDLPSFLGATSPYSFSLPLLRRHFEILGEGVQPTVLVNTFDALESNALQSIETIQLKGIGPLVPSSLLDDDGQDEDERSTVDYIEWLNSKLKGSVIYVSFGSISVLSERQQKEMARGLLGFGRPFLWVTRNVEFGDVKEEVFKEGMIVPWCSQLEVLSHPSVGCFVTHCGWNSTMESLVCGVPVVGFPQWTDQYTNAKLVEDMWGTGVRVKGEGFVTAREIKRCLEVVIQNGEIMKEKAKKWREMARKASREGGSSQNNLWDFINHQMWRVKQVSTTIQN